MPATISFISTMDHDAGSGRDNRVELYQLMEAPGSTDAIRLQGDVVVQLSGTATAIEAWVEHATRDPASAEANWAPAEDDAFLGDLSAGIAPRPYIEPATGFWRVRVVSISGGNCKVSIVGERT
jgi:hypothetical protein